ncbi:MAG: DnaB-like helicase N-terminal domain-containing protein, partial [Oscillospiraceae bacterium]
MATNRDNFDFEGGGLPFSSEAEQSVLGAILIDPQSIIMVMDTLKSEHFYIPQNKRIYEILTMMSTQSQVIDFVTVLERLRSEGLYDDAGGKTYLTTLVQSVPSSANIITYANIIKERYYVRSLIIASRDIIQMATEGVTDANLLIDSAEQRIYEIRQGRETTGLKHIADVIQNETYDRLTKISNPETKDDYVGIPTGISDLDAVITGLNKSD